MNVMDMLADVFEDTPEIRTALAPISQPLAQSDSAQTRGFSPISPVSPPRGEKTKKQVAEEEVNQEVDWLKPCPVCFGHLFVESNRGGFFCVTCQPLPEGAKALRVIQSRKAQKMALKITQLHGPQDNSQTQVTPHKQNQTPTTNEKNPGLKWCQDHLDELLAAGWTEIELFNKKWPLGLAWMRLWSEPGVTVSLEPGGSAVFIIKGPIRTVRQVARPDIMLIQ